MYSRNYRDLIAGGLLIVFGVGVAWHASTAYDMGTPGDFGPGLFPASLGVIAAILGIAIAAPATVRQGSAIGIRVRSLIFIVAGIAAFALLIRPFGVIPAIVAVTAVSSFAEEKVRLSHIVGVSAVLCVLAFLIFKLGLGLTLPMIDWP